MSPVVSQLVAPTSAGQRPDWLCDLYLDLLEKTLTGAVLDDVGYRPGENPTLASSYRERMRQFGLDWPSQAHTMIGLTRLRHLRHLIGRVLDERVPGDFIETGVWRGGACIYMRAVLAVQGVTDRRIWAADSFEGLPPPDPQQFPADSESWLHRVPMLSVSLEEVRRNFEKYNMLDDLVVFLKGWFRDTLPAIPAEQRFAILRMDGDLYESTIQSLTSLYPMVSPNGFVVVDDYNLPFCREAVTDFRRQNAVGEEIEKIDGSAVYWRKRSN
jgi:hypothetical protein